ncbi:hypothetical protein EBU99_02540 [bacterium]|nr:hypothetical protein [bacterium]
MNVNPSETHRAGFFRSLLRAIAFVCCLFGFSNARADEFEVLKQKGCNLLISSSSELRKGAAYQVQTLSGKSLNFRITKVSGGKAFAQMTGRMGHCPRVQGTLATLGSSSGGSVKKLQVGVQGELGLLTFRQAFSPNLGDQAADDGSQPQNVNGLSGLGFSAGANLRYNFRKPFAFDVGLGMLSATTGGKTTLPDNDTYTVSAKFMELTIHPGLLTTTCLSSRLFCRGGAVFGFPISSSLTVKSSAINLSSSFKYLRMGGEVAAGINLGKNFTILGGGQIGSDKGSFQFAEDQAPTPLNTLTVYIYAGILAAF